VKSEATAPVKADAIRTAKAETAPRKHAAPEPKSRATEKTATGSSATALAAAARSETSAAKVPTGEARYRWIAHAAYLRAEKRGFTPGQEVDDWLAAEAEFLVAHGLSPG
jgi:hypothetical protein